jgi:hypothetical protein
LLESAPETRTSPDEFVIQMMLEEMSGRDALAAEDRTFNGNDA